MIARIVLGITTSVIAVCTFVSSCFAGAYGEHKAIGDRGAVVAASNEYDSLALRAFCARANVRVDSSTLSLVLGQGSSISYGDLAALAGDHTLTAYELQAHLASPRSHLHEVIQLQHEAAEHGHFSASNLSVALADSKYLPLALNNFSHFYDFGKSLREHLRAIRLEEIDGLVQDIEQPLIHTNAIAKYCTLHSAAIMLAEMAGAAELQGSPDLSRDLLRRAFILNAFADHFLQDAFAPGHLILRRTVVGSYLTDLQLHDYYNRQGLRVVNARKDRWLAYGDDEMFLHRDGDTNTLYAIEATAASLRELLAAYNGRYDFTNGLSEAASENRVIDYMLLKFKALQIIPLPYGSFEEIERATLDGAEREELKLMNTLDHEGPVVSRLGLEIIGGINTDVAKDYGVAIYAGLSMKGIGFDKHYVSGAWHNLGLKVEHELKPLGRSVAWIEYQNVSNDYSGLRSILPFDFLLGAGLGFSERKSALLRAGVFINYLPLQARPASMISKLDPRLRILFDLGRSTTHDPGILKRVLFGVELNLNPVIDLSLLPSY